MMLMFMLPPIEHIAALERILAARSLIREHQVVRTKRTLERELVSEPLMN